jgi:hypothetical protein
MGELLELVAASALAPADVPGHGLDAAEVAELLGDSKRVAADHYVYALTNYREVDRSIVLARVRV